MQNCSACIGAVFLFLEIFILELGAISCYPLYLFLAKGARKRMPLLSGLEHLFPLDLL
jgi:hypothetical protein